jgi:hypothetical protein
MSAGRIYIFIIFLSNTFLDWDGLSHMSTIEQLFNPSKYDISRRTEQGI